MTKTPKIAVIIVAGGKGERAGGGADSIPKQYRAVSGKPVIVRAIQAFLADPDIALVQPVVRAETLGLYNALPLPADARLLPPVRGGETRQGSVLAGLEALAPTGPDTVLIHDAARPIVPRAVIDDVIAHLATARAVLPAVAVTDTIKRSEDGRTVAGTEDRSTLFAAQTPQGFAFAPIFDAHRRAAQISDAFTDDTAIAEWAGLEVVLSRGSADNIKITHPGDIERAEQILDGTGDEKMMETRVGSGLDIHPFVAGDAVILGGVRIPHTARLKGHSDADAGLHVLTDALLGALAEGDIGTHFPPSDPQWKGAPSETFLRFAVDRVVARGGRILHLDLTINAEAPKIGPHVAAMRQNIARICAIAADRVSVKATTAEKMGFVGRQEGLLTLGTATIALPGEPRT